MRFEELESLSVKYLNNYADWKYKQFYFLLFRIYKEPSK